MPVVLDTDHLSILPWREQALDLRIASIAIVTNSTLLSRNLRDFRRVPGLTAEDWTVS